MQHFDGLIDVTVSLVILVIGYIRLRMQIDKAKAEAKADAQAREDKIRAESLARESKLKSEAQERENKLKADAEQIQQNAQKFVQETATRLQEQIFERDKRYDALHDQFTTVITDNARLTASHEQMSAAFDALKTSNSELQEKYDGVVAKLAESTEQLHQAQLQLKDAQLEKIDLLQQVDYLKLQMESQNTRLKAVEESVAHEKERRLAAEARAQKAEEDAKALEDKLNQVKNKIQPPAPIAEVEGG